MAYGAILGQSFENSPVLNNYFTKNETLTGNTASLFGLPSSAVPDDVLSVTYNLIQDYQTTANGKASITTGSYVGTGNSGPGNKNNLSFQNGLPSIIFIYGQTNFAILFAKENSAGVSWGVFAPTSTGAYNMGGVYLNV